MYSNSKKSNNVPQKLSVNTSFSLSNMRSSDDKGSNSFTYVPNQTRVMEGVNYPSTIVRPEQHIPIAVNNTNAMLQTFKPINQSTVSADHQFKVPLPPANQNSSFRTNAASLNVSTGAKKKENVESQTSKVLEKKNINESIHFFTGTAEKIIKWHKMNKKYFCLYELIASIISIQPGTERLQQVMLLRDQKGPVMQVVHYINDHINIENFHVGQMLRCVGRMIGPNMMHGISIRVATDHEIATLQRMCLICDDAVAKSLRS